MERLLSLFLRIGIFLAVAQGLDYWAEVGRRTSLPCPITLPCGEVYSIAWYKGTKRIVHFNGRVARPNPEFAARVEVEYSLNQSTSSLVLKDVELEDEGIYKCRITYVEVGEECQNEHLVNFTTLIKPEFVRAVKADNNELLENGTVLRSITEDETISLICEAGGAKPIPDVQWWNGTSQIQAQTEEVMTGHTGTGRARIQFAVSRGDLGVKYECRAYHKALPTYISTYLKLDVDVRPKGLKMSGVNSHVVRGSKVELQCVVLGARPAANVTWYNGTTALQETSSTLEIEGDGTYDTISRLVFTATRFENEVTLGCEASNEIMARRDEEPFREMKNLEVLYPPIVTVSPENITVNESTDVLMFCQYLANPATLKSVKWLRDDKEVDTANNKDHYIGGNVEQISLLIKNATREDMGNYTCILENEVGAMSSQNFVYVSIYFKPETRVRMNPTSPVIASEELDVTLFCQVDAGNPPLLTHVRWFLDGVILKELPDCSNTTFCDVNPIQLFLEGITRNFHGNYSCMGKNEAGWGPRSPDSELIVYYPPSGTDLIHTPERVVKRGSMTLYCSVKDRGRPENTTYRWTRGNHPVMDISSANWTIDPVTLEAETNFTCTAVNLGGESKPAILFIKVYAPPTFIARLPPYFGAVMTSQQIQVTCRVECSPICSIEWEKNGHRLETGPHARYYVENIVIPPDTRTNDFESVQSTLIWNMTSWPGRMLDRIADNANYTCISTGNEVGSGVKSTTFFGVEYPPENLTVSNTIVNVIEGNVPEKVLCNAKAYPEASYQWRREGDNEVIIKGNALILNFPILRKNGGNYFCEAYNRHGNNTQKTFINVLYKPECGIIKKEVDGKLSLECTVIANPQEVDFIWKIKNENETIDEHIEKNGLQSILTIETRVENFRTYLCFANNSVGLSIPCEMDVSGSLSWWARLENENLFILLAVIAGIVLMVIVICVIIIIVCRRKRAADKYNNTVELEDRENPEGVCNNNNNNNTSGSRSGDDGRGKWPLRPGVHVHVNTNHSLLASSGQNSTLIESQESRATRIKNMFTPDQGERTIPGVFSSRTGVVTFKRPYPALEAGTMRKQKNSSNMDPNAANKDNKNASPNDALLPPEGDKAFYENLPFHNMQNPPNKPSRPPSRMSSGYGSSRSQQKMPARKFLTVRPLGARTRHWPQFRSLRCSRTGGTAPVPAPRQFLPRPPQDRHLYQNVPVPIVPNTASHTSESSTSQKPAEESSQDKEAETSEPKIDEGLAITKSKIKERLQNSGCERRARPRRKPSHHGSAREIGGPLSREDYSKYKTTPHSSRNSSPPRASHHRTHRAHHTSPRNHAEYAFIKFHDVGQEIDV